MNRVNQLVKIAHEELRKNTDMGLEAAYHAIDEAKKLCQKSTRHPSGITLNEFLEVAKIMNGNRFADWMVFRITKFENTVKLSSEDCNVYFIISWPLSAEYAISIAKFHYGTGIYYNPDFQESIQIAAYLDSISIEYRPKN